MSAEPEQPLTREQIALALFASKFPSLIVASVRTWPLGHELAQWKKEMGASFEMADIWISVRDEQTTGNKF